MTKPVWTDWRGSDFTIGDTVIYATMSGRSCMETEAVVEDMWEVYKHPETYKWVKLEHGETAPEHETRVYVNPQDTTEYSHYYHREWDQVIRIVPIPTERRARVRPTGRTSRWSRYDKREDGTYRAVTLQITESITKV